MNSWDVLAQAEAVSTTEKVDRYTALMRVLIGHLQGLRAPQEIQPVLEVARDYWTTAEGDPDALLAAKVKCWEVLDPIPLHQHLDTPDSRFARALLCVLDPVPEENSEDQAQDFAEWFTRVVWDTF
ncbi:hypothetical protein OHC50_08235 [Paenarthrobacter ilicis]|uniref:hypothetical protein n=1 Tax=Paenarthrobacter ilicis TaxID=43665 RepID=UPI00300AF364